ncbi:hypothetical protein BH11ARM2_BH11ARM2_34850 [soil metagenome]
MAELVWEGKYDKDGRRVGPVRVALPFQTVETVNESAQERDRSLFAEDTPWRNRLRASCPCPPDRKKKIPKNQNPLPTGEGRVGATRHQPPSSPKPRHSDRWSGDAVSPVGTHQNGLYFSRPGTPSPLTTFG